VDGCLRSIADQRPTVDHEIVVIDNASTDGTPAMVRERWPAARVIDAGANLGFARGNNLGFRQTFGELVLLLNPDTRVGPGALSALVALLDARPDAAIVGPRLVDEAGRAELSFGSMLSPLVELRRKTLNAAYERGFPLVAGYVAGRVRRPREVDWVSGACLLVRRADAEAAGLMDERFFMYTEDVDFCAAIRARGRKVLFTPDAEVIHLRGRSRASAAAATEQAYRRSQLVFYEKHHPGWVPLLRAYLKMRGRLPDTRK
jgi:N-acetylglucosaminyl-diphospho-decaprenol L-rhamnosyltransferase